MAKRNFRHLKTRLKKHANPQRAKNSLWFFKTGKGEYGEGDIFLGIANPIIRKIAKEFDFLTLNDLAKTIKSKFHEERLVALLILVSKFANANPIEQKDIYDFYLENTKYINNWDLVDLSAHKIIGLYLENKNRKILYKLAKSKNLWERRIAVISTFYFINQGDAYDALKLAVILIYDKHDLIHKAVGWMLREVGKRCGEEIEEKFLKKHCKIMPRTMLRYAIEKFSDKKRKKYLNA